MARNAVERRFGVRTDANIGYDRKFVVFRGCATVGNDERLGRSAERRLGVSGILPKIVLPEPRPHGVGDHGDRRGSARPVDDLGRDPGDIAPGRNLRFPARQPLGVDAIGILT